MSATACISAFVPSGAGPNGDAQRAAFFAARTVTDIRNVEQLAASGWTEGRWPPRGDATSP